jgi:hypothetical protein
MTKTSRERRNFPVPMRWSHAGSDPSRGSHRGQRTVTSLTRSQPLLRCPSNASDLTCEQIRPPHSAGITSNPELGAGIKSP